MKQSSHSHTDDATITFTRFKKDFIFEAPLYLHICNIYNICNIFRFKKDSIFEASLYLHICNNCNICNIFRFKKDSIFEAPSYLHICNNYNIYNIFRFKKDFIIETPLYLHICNIYNIYSHFLIFTANMPPLFLGQFSQNSFVGVLSFLGGGRGCAGTLTRSSTRHLLPKNFEKTGLKKKGGHICGKN